MFKREGHHILAHRYSWQLTYGPIPPGLFVCHRCDNRPCVRPDHLFLGTNAENTADRMHKGRGSVGDRHWTRQRPAAVLRGERHPRTHLTAADITDIRAAVAGGVPQGQVATRYRVARTTVGAIVRMETWPDD